MNAPALILNIFAWIIILIFIRRIYVKQEFRPKVWKMGVVVFVGLFSFSINLPFMDQQVKIAILPLGVWILYGIYSKKNEGKSWEKYRKFAWLGFFANYIFLIMSLSIGLLHEGMYPKNELSTYLDNLRNAELITTHPSGISVQLERDSLTSQLNNFKKEAFYSEQWYQETYFGEESEAKKDERFPYQLVGFQPKWGSGISSIIFIERDGKGLLISTPKEQFYFTSEKSFLKEVE